MRDYLAINTPLSTVAKKIKITQEIFQEEHRSELSKHYRRLVRYIWKRTAGNFAVFSSRA